MGSGRHLRKCWMHPKKTFSHIYLSQRNYWDGRRLWMGSTSRTTLK